MKYTIKQRDDIYFLQVNDKPCVCPFKSGVPIQNNLGQLQILNNDCNSLCPFFHYENSVVQLECTGVIKALKTSLQL